jgi:hypothetical protein
MNLEEGSNNLFRITILTLIRIEWRKPQETSNPVEIRTEYKSPAMLPHEPASVIRPTSKTKYSFFPPFSSASMFLVARRPQIAL